MITRATTEAALNANTKHGLSGTPIYDVWSAMKARCENPRAADYRYYGARGIKVCPEWSASVERFAADVGPKPSPLHSFDRRDNDGDYTPENCRWATKREQARNRRSNTFIEHEGERLTIAEWSERTGIGVTTIAYRFKTGRPTHEVFSRKSFRSKT